MPILPIEESTRKLLESGVATKQTLIGCSDVEIAELEAKFGLKLPATYKEYLGMMGKGAGWYAEDFQWKFGRLEWIRQAADDLLVVIREQAVGPNDWVPKLKKSHFVMVMRYGDYFLYFDAEAGDDPPILTSDYQEPFFPSFSQWFVAGIDGEIATYRRLKEKGLV